MKGFNKRSFQQAGFTIVELIIVIVVIAILAGLTIVAHTAVLDQAATVSLKSDLDNAAAQLESDYKQTGSYPDTAAQANSGKGLAASEGNTLTYIKLKDTYCVAAASSRDGIATFYRMGNGTSTEEGSCPTDTPNVGFVSSFAGSGAGGFADGVGNVAQFYYPHAIVRDSSGNLFVADKSNYRIRKITPSGVVSTFAGSSTSGLANGTGSAAQFTTPSALAFDSAGVLYVADTTTVRKITTAGVVTTLATDSSGNLGYALCGIAVGSSGIVYVSDSYSNRLRKISAAGTVSAYSGSGTPGFVNGSSTASQYRSPCGLAMAPDGSVYVADSGNHCIRKVTTAGVSSSFAGSCGTLGWADGTGTGARFNAPRHIAVDSRGILYVTDSGNNRIRKITPSGEVTTVTGTGVAGSSNGDTTRAQFNSPYGIAVDSAGALYVVDSSNHRIRKIE